MKKKLKERETTHRELKTLSLLSSKAGKNVWNLQTRTGSYETGTCKEQKKVLTIMINMNEGRV